MLFGSNGNGRIYVGCIAAGGNDGLVRIGDGESSPDLLFRNTATRFVTQYGSEQSPSSYGLILPDMKNWTADRTVATTTDLADYVTLNTAQNITANKTFYGDSYGINFSQTSGQRESVHLRRKTIGGSSSSSADYDLLHVRGEGDGGTVKTGILFNNNYAIVADDNTSASSYRYFKLPTKSAGTYTLATTADIPSVSGFVTGPSSSTDGNVAVFNGTTGKIIKDSGLKLYTQTASTNRSIVLMYGADAGIQLVWPQTGSTTPYFAVAGSTTQSNGTDLGTISNKWKNLYLSGNLSDGINSVSIANIVTKDTAQEITGTKTFKNEDGIVLKPTTTGANGIKFIPTYDEYSDSLTIQNASGTDSGVWVDVLGNFGVRNVASFRCISKYGSDALYFGHTEEGTFDISNGSYSIYNSSGVRTYDGNIRYRTYYQTTSGSSTTEQLSTYGLKFPETKAWTADRTIATLNDIPSVSGFVTGPNSATADALVVYSGTTGKIVQDSCITTSSSSGTMGSYAYLHSTLNGLLLTQANNYGVLISKTADNQMTVATTGAATTSNLGSSTYKWSNLFLSGNLSDGTNSTTISAIKTHLDNSTIHVTSANKTAWNGKVADVKVTEVTSSTTGAGYQKIQQSKDSGSTYTDVVACLSYNEAYAILSGN